MIKNEYVFTKFSKSHFSILKISDSCGNSSFYFLKDSDLKNNEESFVENFKYHNKILKLTEINEEMFLLCSNFISTKKISDDLLKLISKPIELYFKINNIDSDNFRNTKIKLECKKCGEVVYVGLVTILNYLLSKNTSWEKFCKNCKKLNNSKYKYLVDKFKISELDFEKSIFSTEKIKVTCNECNAERFVSIRRMCETGNISCKCTSKNSSIGEKLIYLLLLGTKIDFEYEKVFDWAKDKRYDFYIPSLKTIIEVHGAQHYDKNRDFSNISKRNYYYEIENDKIKKQKAKENGIDFYLEFNCMNSSLRYIFNSFLGNPQLCEIFKIKNIEDLSNFYNENLSFDVNRYRLLKVMESWNNKKQSDSIVSLAKNLKMDRKTYCDFLKKGNDLNLCNYEAKTHREFKYETLKILNLSTNENFEFFNNSHTSSEISKMIGTSISTFYRYVDGYSPTKTNKIYKFEVTI